jgi:cytochrome c-type biogenesis protein CcsB
MTSIELTTYVTFGYLACGILTLIACVATQPGSAFRKTAVGLLVVVWVIHTGAIGLRWVESYQQGMGHAPLSNLYESLVFFGWAIALALLLARWRFAEDLTVMLGVPVVFITMASTFLMKLDAQIKPLIPALQSNWLAAHVFSCFLGYAGFTVSFVAALILLAGGDSESPGRFMPRPELLDEIVYRAVLVGFPMLTLGIITGAAWADYAWGNYWSWDPKETWSLVTWMVYSAFLHARIAKGWSGRRMALLSIAGFGSVLFTYFGVNMLLPGLHSYF